jgi:hypothetical protein
MVTTANSITVDWRPVKIFFAGVEHYRGYPQGETSGRFAGDVEMTQRRPDRLSGEASAVRLSKTPFAPTIPIEV